MTETSVTKALPPLKTVIGTYELAAKKTLGQNFLCDLNLTAKIARAAGKLDGKNVIEIGPGPGGLTRALLDTGAQAVYAVEFDPRCVAALTDYLVPATSGRLHIIAADALTVDYTTLCPQPRALAANLPYNIATPLLTGWLKQLHLFDSLTLMFQKEVADRLTAKPGTKSYGRLSILTQWLCRAEKKFDIPPSAFTPPPKITSTVVHLTPQVAGFAPPPQDVEILETLTAAAFGQRRKMLRQSLKSLPVDSTVLLEKSGILPTARAEDIPVAGYLTMLEVYKTL